MKCRIGRATCRSGHLALHLIVTIALCLSVCLSALPIIRSVLSGLVTFFGGKNAYEMAHNKILELKVLTESVNDLIAE